MYEPIKSFTMHRVDIFSFLASDAKELTKMQTRLNQWMTSKSLVKYEIHTAGEYIIFNVCRKKEEGAQASSSFIYNNFYSIEVLI